MSPKSKVGSAGTLEDSLSLKEFMQAVSNELVESEEERIENGHAPIFKVDSLEIEASVVVKERVEGKGGFNIQVVSVGASGGIEHEAAHRITLKLSAIDNGSSRSDSEFSIDLLGIDDESNNSEKKYSIGVLPVSLTEYPDVRRGGLYLEDMESEDDE